MRDRDEADTALFRFKEVTERYYSKDYSFVVGVISLADLVAIKDELPKRNIFIAKMY